MLMYTLLREPLANSNRVLSMITGAQYYICLYLSGTNPGFQIGGMQSTSRKSLAAGVPGPLKGPGSSRPIGF